MSSTRKCANLICSLAFLVYFAVIIFQFPIFSVPCRIGICKTPVEVTSSQLIASDVFPPFIVKTLLYPGALAKGLYNNKTIPNFGNLLKLYKFNSRQTTPTSDLHRLEVLAGSYLSVGGAIMGLIKPGRMGLFGILLVIWGLIRESIMFQSGLDEAKAAHIGPAMWVALVSAFLSIRKDVRKIIRTFKGSQTLKHKYV
ncbi:uncharacterized protein LOC129291484 [Prosopis cineraria]|uniref:uncharacterized protein LOC129291484 n=1 Tax=Prosopis cineraria TaxID=364024 RepID=UPI00240EF2BD|nr:uncharacterized protein LOC129291484 [Prosopis cineraria]XP_054784830.1 uncharacterized protein LOC129291484 [Prosopis cineraria]